MRTLLPLLACSVLLAGCGPKTIHSIIFPTRYAVTTTVDFRDGDRTVRQTVVSGCKVIDQTDSIAPGIDTTVTGERHWIRRADGSLWILGLLNACRWGVKGPQGETVSAAILPDAPPGERPRVWRLSHSLTYRFDDPVAPRRLDTYDTRELFEAGVDGLSAAATITPVGGKPTNTLDAAFPYLREVEAAEKALKADRSRTARQRRRERGPGGFDGVAVVAKIIENGECPGADGSGEEPVLVTGGSCDSSARCGPPRAAELPCYRQVGGLKPEIAPDFGTIRYSLDQAEPGFVGTYVRTDLLKAAHAPGLDAGAYPRWTPRLCIEDTCLQLQRMDVRSYYYPSRRLLVSIRTQVHQAGPAYFLARPGPVWGGDE